MLTRGWASAWSCRPSSWRCRTPSALKGVDPSQLTGSPQVIAALPSAVREPVVSSFVSALSTVFVSAVPIVLLAFVLTWFLKENTLRGHDDTGAEPVEPAGSI